MNKVKNELKIPKSIVIEDANPAIVDLVEARWYRDWRKAKLVAGGKKQ